MNNDALTSIGVLGTRFYCKSEIVIQGDVVNVIAPLTHTQVPYLCPAFPPCLLGSKHRVVYREIGGLYLTKLPPVPVPVHAPVHAHAG